jgi:hypothetical protein
MIMLLVVVVAPLLQPTLKTIQPSLRTLVLLLARWEESRVQGLKRWCLTSRTFHHRRQMTLVGSAMTRSQQLL